MVKDAPATPPIVFAAPHRALFLIGVVQFVAMMAWWSGALLDLLGTGPGLPAAIPPSLLHAPIMLFMVLPPLFFGFLLTVMPRWIGYPDTGPRIFVPVALAFAIGTGLLWLGLGGWLPRGILAGLTLAALGWTYALGYMTALLLRERAAGKPPTWHGWSAMVAVLAGLLCLIAALAGITRLDAQLVHGANLLALGLFVLPVFVTVCHRMIPFFAGNVVANYVRWRPFKALALFWLASLVSALGYAFALPSLAATGNAALAATTGLMLWKWLPRAAAPGLLWVLVTGFAWAPTGFALLAYTDLFAPHHARAALHLLTVGLAGSLIVAMVTRVTQGHSGRALTMPRLGWLAFVTTQAAAILRFVSGFAGEDVALLAISALILTLGLLPWALRSSLIYLTPRIDGKAG